MACLTTTDTETTLSAKLGAIVLMYLCLTTFLFYIFILFIFHTYWTLKVMYNYFQLFPFFFYIQPPIPSYLIRKIKIWLHVFLERQIFFKLNQAQISAWNNGGGDSCGVLAVSEEL